MNQIQGWRFGHPDLDRSADRLGLTLTPRNTIQLVAGDDAVRQAVLLLLSTRPGERVMRPDYGCAIHTLVFSPNDDTTAALAIHYVRRALQRWEPRINILNIDAGQHPEETSVLRILLVYQVRATHEIEQLQLDVNLAGA